MNKILLFLTIFCTQIACQKLSDALDSAVLSCGPSIDSALWIKVHPGDGLSLPSDLKAVGLKPSSALPEALKMTEKGCVQVDEFHETVVISSALTKFGAVYGKNQSDRDIRLKNIGDLKTARHCESEIFTNKKLLQLPLHFTQGGDDLLQKAFRVQVSIQEASQEKSFQLLSPFALMNPISISWLAGRITTWEYTRSIV
ncbi:hypothetical protein [Oligoflexus tunisiensis]|uniref:hypothetical protein n=1 Tax=Oligoflexus tunisiensis TaxID=708132 RepID=UPI00114CE50C|nr:hypothetical protein [Oligoflexus tunisiensis]